MTTQPGEVVTRSMHTQLSIQSSHGEKLAYCHFEQYHGSMPSLPTERQQQIASFLHSESRKRGIAPTQREIAERFGFASLNSVRSHLRLMEKKGMLNRKLMNGGGSKIKNFMLRNFFRSSWGERRELPEVAPKSFNEMWKGNGK